MMPFCDFSYLNSPILNLSDCPSPSPLPGFVLTLPDFPDYDFLLKTFLGCFNLDMVSQMPSSKRPYKKCRCVEYCNVCRKNIREEGKRGQGPRRHIMQFHLKHPAYKCPHCDYGSNYDRAHVSSHLKHVHPTIGGEVIVVDKAVYQKEEAEWNERCFGISPKEAENKEAKAESPKSVSRLHSIDNILSCDSSPTSSTVSSTVIPELSADYLQSLLLVNSFLSSFEAPLPLPQP